MANELSISQQGAGLNLYVVIRRLSDAKVWDVTNTVFATFSDAAIDDYDVVMTDQGGDLYQANFPTSIAAATRVVALFYKRLGATPAITDTLLLSLDTTWNGTVLTLSSSVTLDSRALTSLASVKRRLNLSTTVAHDTLLTDMINQVSDWIERIAGRRFASSSYQEWLNPNGEDQLALRNWPLIRVDRLYTGSEFGLDLDYSGTGVEGWVSVYFDEEGRNGTLRLQSTSAAGTDTTTTASLATYPTLSTLATQIATVSGWTASRSSTYDSLSETLWPISGVDAKNQTAKLYHAYDFERNYRVDHRNGMVVLGARASTRKLVSYTAGYTTIPDDVAQLANELIAQVFGKVTQNAAIKSESIPDYSYTLADDVELSGSQTRMLERYSTISIGVVL